MIIKYLVEQLSDILKHGEGSVKSLQVCLCLPSCQIIQEGSLSLTGLYISRCLLLCLHKKKKANHTVSHFK